MAQLIDETGRQYGWLTVVERAGSIRNWAAWLCRCECGNSVVAKGALLRNGTTRSCGCLQRLTAAETAVDETGRRYGRLTVLGRDGSNSHGIALWMCRCDCGNKLQARGSDLRSGHTVSCGCRREDMLHSNALPRGEAAKRSLLLAYRRAADQRGLEWALSMEEFVRLTSLPCHYCGQEPGQVFGNNGLNGKYIYSGLDRTDNKAGYTVDNVVPCCGACNRMKGTMDYGPFLELVGRISSHRPGVSFIGS